MQQLLNEMIENGLEPNSRSYELMLDSFRMKKDINQVLYNVLC
jgi:hypothetical protein